MKKTEYIQYDALGLTELVANGEVTPKELSETSIALIEQYNPKINAVIANTYDFADRQIQSGLPSGPFYGVPFLVKDFLMDVAGYPTSNGSRLFINQIADSHSTLVQRYLDAGVVLIGKTNTPEFAAAAVTEPLAFGPTRNPWNLSKTPGGSSGGSAAAVASRFVPMAHGTDAAGSLRVPASCCGIFTLKPTRGLTPTYVPGMVMRGMSVDNVVSISVRDCAAMLDATKATVVGAPFRSVSPDLPYLEVMEQEPQHLRIAMTTEPMVPATVHPDVIIATEKAANLCEKMGHHVEVVQLDLNPQHILKMLGMFFTSGSLAYLRKLSENTNHRDFKRLIEPENRLFNAIGECYSNIDYEIFCLAADELTTYMEEFFTQYDMLLTPVISAPPLAIGENTVSNIELIVGRLLSKIPSKKLHRKLVIDALTKGLSFPAYTGIFNMTGQPGISVPLHWNGQGLPIGVQFTSKTFNEGQLLQLAHQLEIALPWKDKLPPLIAD